MAGMDAIGTVHSVALNRPWDEFAHDKAAITFLEENIFYDYMRKCRWFAGKARMVKFLKVQQLLDIPVENSKSYLVILRVGYTYGDEEKYSMPVSFLPDD